MSFTSPIDYYDFHFYYYKHNGTTREKAVNLRNRILEEFNEEHKTHQLIIKQLRDEVVGPHPTNFFEVDVRDIVLFGRFLSWVQLNRGELSVLVHPQSGDALKDHREHALWLGDKLPILFEVLEKNRLAPPKFGLYTRQPEELRALGLDKDGNPLNE